MIKLKTTTKKYTKNRKKRVRKKPTAKIDKTVTQDTLPEILTQKMLSELGVEFTKQYELCGFSYDLIIPEKRILIEVDGDYWHSNPLLYPSAKMTRKQKKQRKRDNVKNLTAIDNGFKLIRVWEKDIKEAYTAVKKELKVALNSTDIIQVLFENKIHKYKQRIIRFKNKQKKDKLVEDNRELIKELTY